MMAKMKKFNQIWDEVELPVSHEYLISGCDDGAFSDPGCSTLSQTAGILSWLI